MVFVKHSASNHKLGPNWFYVMEKEWRQFSILGTIKNTSSASGLQAEIELRSAISKLNVTYTQKWWLFQRNDNYFRENVIFLWDIIQFLSKQLTRDRVLSQVYSFFMQNIQILDKLASKIQAPLMTVSNFHKMGHNPCNIWCSQPKISTYGQATISPYQLHSFPFLRQYIDLKLAKLSQKFRGSSVWLYAMKKWCSKQVQT